MTRRETLSWSLGEVVVATVGGRIRVPALVAEQWAIHSKVIGDARRVNSGQLQLTHAPTGCAVTGKATNRIDAREISRLADLAQCLHDGLPDDARSSVNPEDIGRHGQGIVTEWILRNRGDIQLEREP